MLMSKLSLIFQIIKKSIFKPGLMLELAEEKSEIKDDEGNITQKGSGNSGDTAWMTTAAVLVLFMTIPGLSLFYGGLVRSKNLSLIHI